MDFNKNQATFGGYQNGFFQMQAVNYESNLQHAVITAETNARYEYFGKKVSDIRQEIEYEIKTVQMIDKMSAVVDLAARDEFRMLKTIDAPGFRFNVGLRTVVGSPYISTAIDAFSIYTDLKDYQAGILGKDDILFRTGNTLLSTGVSYYVGSNVAGSAIAAGSTATVAGGFVSASLGVYYFAYKWFRDYLYPGIYYRVTNIDKYILSFY